MNIFDLIKGKKMMVDTDMGVAVELEILNIEPVQHSVDLEPATPQNDWWPASRDWVTYKVIFTNGKSKEFSNINDINFY
jgi:hypothetical protein